MKLPNPRHHHPLAHSFTYSASFTHTPQTKPSRSLHLSLPRPYVQIRIVENLEGLHELRVLTLSHNQITSLAGLGADRFQVQRGVVSCSSYLLQ